MAENSSSKTFSFLNLTILAGLCFLLLFRGLGDLPFFTRGEPREGLVVWEMNASGNWTLPVVNGEYIPFKPPLFHWFAAVAGHLFGHIDEFTLRLPSAIFAALGVLMTYLAGARLWGQRAGLVAGIVLVTCAEWWQAGTETQVDMTLAFFITAACLYFYSLYTKRDLSLAKSLALFFLLGLAALSKGPIGLALPLLIFLVFLWLRHDFAFVKKLHPFAGAAVFLLVAGSWYGAALWLGGPAFFFRQIVDENFRTAAGTYGHYQPVYYYLPIFLENTLPWSLFYPVLSLFVYRRRKELSAQHLVFPLIWFAVVFLFFTASLGKRGVYLLPLYPAVALLYGAWWHQLEENQALDGSLARVIGFVVAAGCLSALAALVLYAIADHGLIAPRLVVYLTRFKNLTHILQALTSPSPFVVACLACYAVAAVCLIRALFGWNWRLVFTSLALFALSFDMIIKTAVFPPIVFARTMKPFMARVNDKLDPKQPLFFYRGFDYGATFYARRHVPSYTAKAQELNSRLFLLMWEEDWQRLAARDDVELVGMSEGRGPAGKHRLALVEYQPNATSASKPLPVHRRYRLTDYAGD